ncbi:MAG TPA: glycosyltransferase family 2 protein [Flavobacteriaceae bacterium]|nr:glycosyltransferase family 2 protein [Flavobacteriaceae bacterium]HIN99697.1 glycosyltransferase family 2 protein [Flavobacteriaceae bacterium]
MSPRVSIIIPTYNRAHLIGETLDSIRAQTYAHWECIVVDDGSTDETKLVLQKYQEQDARFIYVKRPENRPKGGNAARNYGFEICAGEFVQWFDSDDLMHPDFLQKKIVVLLDGPSIPFVVSRTENFNTTETFSLKKYDNNLKRAPNFANYIKGIVYWMTPDFLIRKDKVGSITFDEELTSGQETNFFIKVLSNIEESGTYINETLTKRRIHDGSIRSELMDKENDDIITNSKITSWLSAYNTIKNDITKAKRKILVNRLINFIYHLNKTNQGDSNFKKIRKEVFLQKGFLKGFAFILAITFKNSKGSYSLVQYSKS